MKKNKILSIILVLFGFFLCSCQSASEALQGKKRSDQSDEFLVEKKNALVMPPDFDKLPTPGNKEVSPGTFSDKNDVKELLSIEEIESSQGSKNNSPADIESSILEKIQ